jgi:hypothetical protein
MDPSRVLNTVVVPKKPQGMCLGKERKALGFRTSLLVWPCPLWIPKLAQLEKWFLIVRM